MSVIWRHAVPLERRFEVDFAGPSELLSLSRNGTGPQLYFRVAPKDGHGSSWVFFVVPTGSELEEDESPAAYVGTFRIEGGLGETLVFHVLTLAPAAWHGWRKTG